MLIQAVLRGTMGLGPRDEDCSGNRDCYVVARQLSYLNTLEDGFSILRPC
jgi:hypothetical protein